MRRCNDCGETYSGSGSHLTCTTLEGLRSHGYVTIDPITLDEMVEFSTAHRRRCEDCRAIYFNDGVHLTCTTPLEARRYRSWAVSENGFPGPVETFAPPTEPTESNNITNPLEVSPLPPKAKAKPAEGITIIAKTSPEPSLVKPSLRTSISTHGFVHSITAPDLTPLQELFRPNDSRGQYVNGIFTATNKAKSFPKLLPYEIAIDQHANLLHALAIPRRDSITLPTPPAYDTTLPPNGIAKVIKAVGFEVEGCWRGREADSPENGGLDFHVVGDASVHSDYASMRTLGEVRLGPYPHGIINEDQVRHQYPDHVNASCGLHVHLSFPSLGIYNTFMSKQFYNWFIEGLKTWRTKQEAEGAPKRRTFWQRINGENTEYCAVNYDPNNSLQQTQNSGRRYNAINYCLAKHGTIEVRVLNAWPSPDECLLAVREVMRLFALWASQFTLPLDAISYGEKATDLDISIDDLPAMSLSTGHLVIHPSYRVARSVYSSPGSTCTLCYGGGLRQLSCGCVEWCSDCQPKRYKAQQIKHGVKTGTASCWRSKGYQWSHQNLLCGVPEQISRYEALYRLNSAHSPCPICGTSHREGHLSRPSSSCMLGINDGIAYGFSFSNLR